VIYHQMNGNINRTRLISVPLKGEACMFKLLCFLCLLAPHCEAGLLSGLKQIGKRSLAAAAMGAAGSASVGLAGMGGMGGMYGNPHMMGGMYGNPHMMGGMNPMMGGMNPMMGGMNPMMGGMYGNPHMMRGMHPHMMGMNPMMGGMNPYMPPPPPVPGNAFAQQQYSGPMQYGAPPQVPRG